LGDRFERLRLCEENLVRCHVKRINWGVYRALYGYGFVATIAICCAQFHCPPDSSKYAIALPKGKSKIDHTRWEKK
jgi:hypothetical protein